MNLKHTFAAGAGTGAILASHSVKWMGDRQSILIGHVQGPPECFDDTSKGSDIANGLGI